MGGYSVDLGIDANAEKDLEFDAQLEYTANRFVVRLDQGSELPGIEVNQRTVELVIDESEDPLQRIGTLEICI